MRPGSYRGLASDRRRRIYFARDGSRYQLVTGGGLRKSRVRER